MNLQTETQEIIMLDAGLSYLYFYRKSSAKKRKKINKSILYISSTHSRPSFSTCERREAEVSAAKTWMDVWVSRWLVGWLTGWLPPWLAGWLGRSAWWRAAMRRWWREGEVSLQICVYLHENLTLYRCLWMIRARKTDRRTARPTHWQQDRQIDRKKRQADWLIYRYLDP